MNNILVRVESIYDLGLAKILQDNGNFDFVSPSKNLQEILKIKAVDQPHQVNISDLDQRVGIFIKGKADSVEKVEKAFRAELPDSILFTHQVQQDSIYHATVTKYIYRKKIAIIDLDGSNNGILFNVECKVGDRLVVQVKELTTDINKLPVCSTIIAIPGNYCILELGASFVRVSKKIQGENRKRLHAIGKELLPEGFGIIIRTSAKDFVEKELREEINKLLDFWNKTQEESNNSENANRVITGEKVSEIVLGYSSKEKLDQILQTKMTIVKDYHLFKSYSMASGFVLEFASHFSDKLPVEKVHSTLYSMIKERDFRINNHIKAEFHYFDGTQEEVNIGNIIENKDEIITQRVVEHNTMDFPSFKVTPTDTMKVSFKTGSWSMHYQFYSPEGENLGQWLRIIAPLDIAYRGRVRVYDMGMHLFKDGEGNVTHHVDDRSRENLVGSGIITKELDEKLATVLVKAKDALQASSENILIIL